jgi:hypothetical protein
VKNPDLYVLADPERIPLSTFSNFEWGKQHALERAKAEQKSQVIYKLVPVHRVEVKVTHEYQIEEIGS